jgi:hypothetical protein
MGKPGTSHVVSPPPEFIGWLEGTPGSETSQYRQEEKTIVIPLVVASERGLMPKPCRRDTCQGFSIWGREVLRAGADNPVHSDKTVR